MRLKRFLGLLAVLFLARQAGADDRQYPSFDERYFQGVSISSMTRLLAIEVLPFQQNDAVNWKLRIFSDATTDQASFCTLSRAFAYFPLTLDCGVRILGHAANDTSVIYYVLLKSGTPDRFEIVRRPDSSETVWLDRDAAGKTYTILPIADWLASGTALQANPQLGENAFQIYDGPALTSNMILSRTVRRYSSGKLPEEGLVVVDRSREAVGEWVPVEWVTSGCVPVNAIPVFCRATPSANEPAGPACVRGWLRWLNADRQPAYYPFITSAGACAEKPKTGLYD